MANKMFTGFSRKLLLLLLLVTLRHDLLCFSAQSGRSLILDPGVNVSLCFSAQSRGRVLPGPGIFLSLLTCQEVSDTLCDLCKCYMLSICLLSLLKLLFHIIM